MGSQGIKRRKRRTRPPAGDGGQAGGGWELRNSPYTFEGQMEGLSRFGRGLSSASPRQRLMAKVVAALFLMPFLLGVLYWLVD